MPRGLRAVAKIIHATAGHQRCCRIATMASKGHASENGIGIAIAQRRQGERHGRNRRPQKHPLRFRAEQFARQAPKPAGQRRRRAASPQDFAQCERQKVKRAVQHRELRQVIHPGRAFLIQARARPPTFRRFVVAVNRNRVPERIMDGERGNDQHRHDPQQPGCDQGMTPVGRPKRRRAARDCGGRVSGGHKSVCQWMGCRVWSTLLFHTFSPCPPACPAPPRHVNPPSFPSFQP